MVLPVFFLTLGFLSYLWSGRKALAFALFFNNFIWFPECLLLFWIFVAYAGLAAKREHGGGVVLAREKVSTGGFY